VRGGGFSSWAAGLLLIASSPVAALAGENGLTLKEVRDLPSAELVARVLAQAVGSDPSVHIEDGTPEAYALRKINVRMAPRPIADRVCRQQILTILFEPVAADGAVRRVDPPSVADRLAVTDSYLLVAPGGRDCAGAGWPPFKASSDAVASLGVKRLSDLLAAPGRWRFSCAHPGCDIAQVRLEDLRSVHGSEGGSLTLNGEIAGRTGWTLSIASDGDVATLWTGPIAPH